MIDNFKKIMIDLRYDEDLTENPFFQELQNDQAELIDQASREGWIICVPRVESFHRSSLIEDDFLNHILVPNFELPESHYRTLSGKQVTVSNKVITTEDDTVTSSTSTHIIFEEIFYVNKHLKYKVWCIENPLDCSYQSQGNNLFSLTSLRDCIDLLWTESLGTTILEQLDSTVGEFFKSNPNLEKCSLQTLKDLVSILYAQCLQIAFRDTRLRDRTSKNKYLLDNIKISIDTYVQHKLYKKIFSSLSVCTAYDDSCFNKIVRNLSDIQLRDLDIKAKLYETIPCAKRQLAKINGYSTILGKVSCLRNTISEISKFSTKKMDLEFLSADDLLPILVFVILKSGIPNWVTNLIYLKQFQFSTFSVGDESHFLIASLEAAVEHIRSGMLQGPVEPESQVDEVKTADVPDAVVSLCDDEQNSLTYFFEQVRTGNYKVVKQILEKSKLQKDLEVRTKDLCHPLCSCDKCERFLSQNLCSTTPTVHSCDDRGFTALHVACMYGKPKIVELLLEFHANIHGCDYSGASPLHYAAMRGHQNALLLLLHSGAHINTVDSEKNTPLHFCCNNGHEGCIKAMLYFSEHQENGLRVDCTNTLGDTPLHYAARWGYESIVQLLLEYGANPNIENKRKKTALDYAHNLKISQIILKTKSQQYAARVIKFNTDSKFDFAKESSAFNSCNEHSKKPCTVQEIKKAELLLRAVAYGDVPLTCYYLGLQLPESHRKSTVSDTSNLCHPLCNCEKCETLDSTDSEQALEKQDINICNSEAFTPLHVASLHGRTDLVKILLSNGALPNVATRKGLTALHLACQTQRHQIIKMLLKRKECNVNFQDVRGNSALHYACYAQDTKIVEDLIAHGANPYLRNANGKTALDDVEEKLLFSLIKIIKGEPKIDI